MNDSNKEPTEKILITYDFINNHVLNNVPIHNADIDENTAIKFKYASVLTTFISSPEIL
jgi:hypothetical protein